MSRFRKSLEECGALSLLAEVRDGERRFICYTAYSDAESLWHVAATDGVDVWRLSLSEEELRDHARDRGEAGYLSDIRHALECGDVQILRTPSHLTLCLQCSSQSVEFQLYELPASERREEMQTLLFSMWTSLESTRSKLAECQKQFEEAKLQKLTDQPAFVDVSLHSSKPSAAKPKRPAGASLVNPSSKRRKAAMGVVFGEDS